MQTFLSTAFVLSLAVSAPSVLASDQDPGDIAAVKACLKNFGKHPFDAESPKFRTMGAKVRVFGIGESSRDESSTDKPELVLVKPNVAVLSKNDLNLQNPNGWYCLKGQVAVLGKSEIKLHCSAKLASSRDGVTVLGANESDTGVTVLGSSRLIRTGCPETKTAAAAKTAESAEPAAEKKDEKKAAAPVETAH